MVIGLEYNSVSNWAGDFKSAECVVKIIVKKSENNYWNNPAFTNSVVSSILKISSWIPMALDNMINHFACLFVYNSLTSSHLYPFLRYLHSVSSDFVGTCWLYFVCRVILCSPSFRSLMYWPINNSAHKLPKVIKMTRDDIIAMAHNNLLRKKNGLSCMPNPFLGKLENKIPWNEGVEFTMHKVCLPLPIYYFSI